MAASLRERPPAWLRPRRESPAARRATPGPERPGQPMHGARARWRAAPLDGPLAWLASAAPAGHGARRASRPSPERELPACEATPSNRRSSSLAPPPLYAPASAKRQPEQAQPVRQPLAERRPPPPRRPQSAPERPAQERQEAAMQEREQAVRPPAPGAPVGASTGRDTPSGRLPGARRDGRTACLPRRRPTGRSFRPPRLRQRRPRQPPRRSPDGAASLHSRLRS